MSFETQNDSEVAAAYLSAEMAAGKDLGQALEGALDDLDGFFTFIVGTQSGPAGEGRGGRQAGRVQALRLGPHALQFQHRQRRRVLRAR